jgi:hypothetical protein
MARNNPAAPVINAAVARLTLTLKTQNTLQEIVLDYLYNIGLVVPTPADLSAFEAQWEANHNTLMRACLSPLTDYFQISVAEIHFGVTPTLVLPFLAGTSGTAGATNLPLEMAGTMQKKSSLKGQHGRGRLSMPAIPNTFTTPATDPNVLNATANTAYLALLNQLILPVTVAGNAWQLAISTRPTPPQTLVTNAVVVSAMTIDPTLGTARTRKPGRGI